ncbi:MAG: hypothetical protein CFH18_00074 [Alphaproteobacteria bacterium MarineAlpha5_Bin8]|nr:MAG: hypothetical protein CFH18_00074 [Alphaproteobacteria bacterium MarineAlpha5_Bin8]PPR53883.1 MAG: hypothetical protein CFH16_00758 [Alphaproteobacteria bacterium MarineAlpha5_Bin6]|tara:strand:+ start:2346 stop:3413 length:1068 start_codon:yes stop_codon:yes gene_type:complete
MIFYPSKVDIETVNRFCNARCPMCTIKFVPDFTKLEPDEESHNGISRKAEVMSLKTFEKIADKFKPIMHYITALNLQGSGEPLLDKTIAKKVNYAKKIGFTNIGFSSNCDILEPNRSIELLESGLDCLIASIDGLTKDVHEKCRPRTNFDKAVENVKFFINYRNKKNYKCKVLPRMVRQQTNIHQWNDYKAYWESLIDQSKGDKVLGMDVHNFGGKLEEFDNMKVTDFDEKNSETNKAYKSSVNQYKNFDLKKFTDKDGKICIKVDESESLALCPDLFSRFIVFTSGDTGLCCADQAGYYKLGNVLNEEVIDIYNNKIFSDYRKAWLTGKVNELKYCNDCSIVNSYFHKSYKTEN